MSPEAVKAVNFMRWARRNAPDVYKRVASAMLVRPQLSLPPMNLAGLGDADPTAATVEAAATQPGFMDSIASIIASVGTYQAQKDCSKYNLELIKAGKSTVSCGDVAGGMNVGLSPETRTLLYVGGGALVLLLLLNILKRGR